MNSNSLVAMLFKLILLLVRERYNEIENLDEKQKKKLDNTKFELEVKNLILFA